MSQNFAARVALTAAGGVGFLHLDDQNRLIVTNDAPVGSSISDFTADSPNAAAVATLAGAAGKLNSLSGFYLSGSGATGASVVLATVTGLAGGTITIPVAVPAGAAAGIAPIRMEFEPPLPASAVDTDIVVTLPALGAGNLHAAVGAWGYQSA